MFEIEPDLLSQLEKERVKDPRKRKPVDEAVRGMLQRLCKDESVMAIVTNKTNAYEVVSKKDYVWWVKGHLVKDGKKVRC